MFIVKKSLEIIIVGTEFTHHQIIMGLKPETMAPHLEGQKIERETKHGNHIWL